MVQVQLRMEAQLEKPDTSCMLQVVMVLRKGNVFIVLITKGHMLFASLALNQPYNSCLSILGARSCLVPNNANKLAW